MGEFIPTLTKALTEQVSGLKRIRKISEFEAWGVMRVSAMENLEISRMCAADEAVAYWRTVAEIADRRLADSSDRRWTS